MREWHISALAYITRNGRRDGDVGGWRLRRLQFAFMDWESKRCPEYNSVLSSVVLAALEDRQLEEYRWYHNQAGLGSRRARERQVQARKPYEDVLPVHHSCGCDEPAVSLRFDARGKLFPEDMALIFGLWTQHLRIHPECLDRMAGRSA